MAEIFSAIGGIVGALPKIKEYVVTPIKNQFSYLFRYDKLIQSLRVQVESLDNKRAGLQLQVDAARRNLQVIDPDVQEWLERVEKIKQDSEKIIGAVPEDQNGACLNGKCPKPKLLYSQSRQATKLTADVVQLQEEFSKLGRIAYPPPPIGIEAIPPPSGTQEFESRKHKEEEIMTCLRDDTIFMIGVCGMGGVGKTTMANKICRRTSEEKIFDEIAIAVVSQLVDLRKIQKEIAEALHLDLKQETVSIRGRLLHTRLMSTNKVLIVLDDIWERLNLEDIGIPSPNFHRGCKIILTTRNRHVCNQMDATKILSLDGLPEQEAWVLFRQKAGTNVDEPDLLDIAKDVTKECNGLPLAIVTVGSALKQQTNKAIWEDALLQLRHAAPINIPGVLKGVYQPLQLSYKALESDEARYLFLLCCLFPEDYRIDLEDLVHYGIGLGIFSNIRNLREARNRVCGLVDTLKSRFLLMDDTSHADICGPRVKMHDVVRDMAIWISSEAEGTKHVFKVSHEIGLSEWPIKDSCENYTAISLTFGKSMVIPKECMNCPNPRLEALLVRCNYSYTKPKNELPDTFFNRMSGLRLLSIYNCIVPSSSLSFLTQLRVLHLYDCGLKEMISFIGELVNLEILSLQDGSIVELPYEMRALTKLKLLDLNYCTNLEKIAPGVISRLVQLEELILRSSVIVELPDEMGALTKLKLLDLNGCPFLKKIAPGVISKLVQLEELRLLNCPIEWEGGEEKGKERSNASVVEVFSLRNLRVLEICIEDPQVIPQDIGGKLEQELTNYTVMIGKYVPVDKYTYQKRMVVNVDEMRQSFVNSMCVLFMGAEHLHLEGRGSKDIIEVLGRQGFQNVKRLDLLGMDDLEKICDGPPTLGSFSKLEQIRLSNLAGLLYSWKCSNEKLCLPNLKKIDIFGCEKLKWVFPLSIAESLCQLETIVIDDCPNMEEVFLKDEISQGSSSEEGGDSDHMNIKFPKLNMMSLLGLPKLSALCKAVDVFEFPSITTLQISEVSWRNLKMLGSRQPDLVNKEVPYIDSMGLRMSQIDLFIGLHELKISYCSELRTLFSSDAFKSLINLKKLSIRNCLILEEIVEKRKVEDQKVLNLPQLESLELSELPEIRCFCNFKNTLEFPSLKEITIKNCPLMETFAVESCSTRIPNSSPKFFFSKEVTFHNLCKLVLYGITTTSVIFSHEFAISELQILEVRHCHFKSLVGKEDDDSISRCFITKEVTCSKLKNLVLDGLKFASLICSHEIPIESLSALENLEVRSCHNLKSLISLRLFGEMTNLEQLVVRDCSILEVVLAEEEVDGGSRDKKITNQSKFEKIELSELPKLRSFYSGLESLPLSKWVHIHGIKDHEFASRVFFNREHCQDEDNLSKGCFTLFPCDLSFTCRYPEESPFLVKGLSDIFYDGWDKACGRFGIEKLSRNITYEIIFVIMLREKSRHYNLTIVVEEDWREEDMCDKPMEEWIEIVAGEYSASSTQSGEIKFFITKYVEPWEGIILKCVHIRPKEPIE